MQCRLHALTRSLRRFAADPSGAQLVEFALVLPMMLVVFGVIIEGGRLMWSFQTVVAGVRDATRFLARVADQDICDGVGDLSGYEETLTNIVRDAYDGVSVLPGGVSVTSVSPSLVCNFGEFRSAVTPPVAPIVTVRAEVEVTFPFAGLFRLVGGDRPTLETSVSDQSRVYGS